MNLIISASFLWIFRGLKYDFTWKSKCLVIGNLIFPRKQHLLHILNVEVNALDARFSYNVQADMLKLK